jgi:long-chain acyl-CoA synthetase
MDRQTIPTDPVLEAFARVRAQRGAQPLFASPARAWTAEDLGGSAERLAVRIAESPLPPGRLVGLAAPSGPGFVAGYLALRSLGLVPVLCDSSEPTPDRLAALDRLGVAAFLWTDSGWPEPDSWVVSRRAPAIERELAPETGAIKLSSGSTGAPRGIAVSSEALLADDAQLAATMGLAAEDRCLVAVPYSHSYGFSSLVLPALVRGSLQVLAEGRGPFAALEAARALSATFFPTVPAFLNALVRLRAAPEWPVSIRLAISAGAPLAPETAAAFRERYGFPVHVFYGASECGGICYDRAGDAAERGTVGTAVDGVALEIDPESGRLRVRSAAVAEGYIPEPAPELAEGAFLTGDLARRRGQEIELAGRADDLVIVRGRNVDPREIERTLSELPGVREVCVLGVEGPDGPRSVLRAVVATPDGALGYREVVDWCRARLAEHKVPRSVVLVAELPRTDRGKLDRSALLALAE